MPSRVIIQDGARQTKNYLGSRLRPKGSFFPGAQVEIGEISSLLSGTLVEAGTLGGGSLSFKAANEEAEKVLEEASSIARERMEEDLPKISVGLSQDDEGLTW